MPRLNIIIASTRPGRVGAQVAEWFIPIARDHGGFDVTVVDLAELNLPFLDEPSPAHEGRGYVRDHTKRWSAITDAADAFVFVMPEYNNGYGAPLKNAIDYLYEEWAYKPVAFVSYGMSSAGLRAVNMIKQVVTNLRMMPASDPVSIPLRQALDADGRLMPTAHMDQAAKELLDELLRLSAPLGALRAGAAA
jgi:NAD(P)H-dependent FMN reductase